MEARDATAGLGAPPMTPAERIAFAFVLGVYLLLSLLVFNQIEEDAFIYFRQAANLVDGYGFTFNRGGERVEAASSPLWLLLLVLLWSAPLDIVITAKLLGIAAGCLSLWLVLSLARRQISNPVLRLGVPLMTVGSVPFLMWSQRGLEPPLVVLIVLWFALCLTDRRWFPWWPAAAVLLLVVRPEAPLFLLALLPALGIDRDRWRAALPGIAMVGLAALALLSVRFLYFHDLAPSPFYVKLHTGGAEGFAQIRKYLVHNHVLLVGLPFFLVAWRRAFWTRERIVLGVLVLVAAGWCALAKDYMPYTRHLVPAIPILYVLVFAAADGLGLTRRRFGGAAAAVYVTLAFILTLFFSRATGEFTSTRESAVRGYLDVFAANPTAFVSATVAKMRAPDVFGFLDYELPRFCTISSTFQSQIGKFLRQNYPPDTVVVYDQMGQTPFYAGATMRFVDSLGLTDRTVGAFYFARGKKDDALLRIYDSVQRRAVKLVFGEEPRTITANEALAYIFEQKPDLILIHTLVVRTDPGGIPDLLSSDERLRKDYELRYTLARFVLVYERREAPRKLQLDVPPALFVVPHQAPSP